VEAVTALAIKRYLDRDRFQGLMVCEQNTPDLDSLGLALHRRELEVITDLDDENPAIKRFRNGLTGEQGAHHSIECVKRGGRVFLYPTSRVLDETLIPSNYAGRPFTERLARGAAQCDLVFTDLSVLQTYRDDPHYYYDADDYGIDIYDTDDQVPEWRRDKSLGSVRAGFALAVDDAPGRIGNQTRRIGALLCDLSAAASFHQTLFRVWERPDGVSGVHPIWHQNNILGEWSEKVGPFQKVLDEIECVNELWSGAYGCDLFQAADRPRGWSWILQRTSGAWESFCHLTDKVINERLSNDALTKAGVPKKSPTGDNWQSLKRLESYLESQCGADWAAAIMSPLFYVRHQRQAPGHLLNELSIDHSADTKQNRLMNDLARSMQALRQVVQDVPAAPDVTVPDHLVGNWWQW
jgi:hypothetical protein